MSQLEQQIALFFKGTGIEPTKGLKQKIQSFFQENPGDNHLIYKRSILYFYNKHRVIDSIASTSKEEHVYTFDGVKVARVKPDYYTGGATSSVVGAAAMNGLEIDFSNNNNNNNNNNNGNNNG